MNYFLLESDPLYTDAPVLRDWSGKIDRSCIMPSKSRQIPARLILDIYPNSHVVFTDVIDFPFLLLSKTCMDVIKFYEPQIVSKQIILLDSENRQKQTYHLPILPHLDCLSEESILSPDRSELKEGILDAGHIGRDGIFHIAGLSRFYTVIRLDVLESMLKRGTRGIKVTPMKAVFDEGRKV